jgi:hypothetical protein
LFATTGNAFGVSVNLPSEPGCRPVYRMQVGCPWTAL